MYAQSVIGFLVMYFFSFFLIISCNDWFLIWGGLEINMMSFISLIYDRSSKSIDLCMKYFFIQSIGSGILLTSFFLSFKWFDFVSLMMLSYKIGGGPFFFWFPPICDMLSWGNCLMLMTVQKFLPLLLISFIVSSFLWMVIISSIFVGALGSLSQSRVKRLMAYSSVNHLGWILLANFIEMNLWLIYLFLYSMMILGVVWSMWKEKILDVGMMFGVNSKWSIVLGMLSMGGMPPMLGFYMKWLMFYNFMLIDFSLLIFMLIMSILMFYVYIRIVYSVIMSGSNLMGWKMLYISSYFLSWDTIYMIGLNTSMVLWLCM